MDGVKKYKNPNPNAAGKAKTKNQSSCLERVVQHFCAVAGSASFLQERKQKRTLNSSTGYQVGPTGWYASRTAD